MNAFRHDGRPCARTTEPLTEPTSVTIAPGLQVRADFLGHRAAGADRDADDDQVGAATASALVSTTGRRGRARPRAPRSRELRVDGDRARRAFARHDMGDRRADQADADEGDLVEQRLAHRGALFPPMNAVSASTTARFSSSVPMVMRSACGKPYSSTRRKMMRRSCRNLSASAAPTCRSVEEMHQQEVAALGVTPKAEPVKSSASHRARARYARRALRPRVIGQRRDAGRDRRARDIERPADTVQRIGDRRSAHRPSRAQRGEPIDLGEGARHHRVGESRPARCRPRSRSCAHIRHRPRRARAARRRAGFAQALHLVEREVGAGRIVRIGEEDDARRG